MAAESLTTFDDRDWQPIGAALPALALSAVLPMGRSADRRRRYCGWRRNFPGPAVAHFPYACRGVPPVPGTGSAPRRAQSRLPRSLPMPGHSLEGGAGPAGVPGPAPALTQRDMGLALGYRLAD